MNLPSTNPHAKNTILIALGFLLLAVCVGAFGAHGLKPHLSSKALDTYQTGVTYQFYHALGLLLLGILQRTYNRPQMFWGAKIFFIIGIFLFSFNCYIYAISGIKFFAMIVPIGGFAFILGWITMILKVKKYL